MEDVSVVYRFIEISSVMVTFAMIKYAKDNGYKYIFYNSSGEFSCTNNLDIKEFLSRYRYIYNVSSAISYIVE